MNSTVVLRVSILPSAHQPGLPRGPVRLELEKEVSTCLQPGRTQKVTIAAGRGWQPTGLSVRAGTRYEYLASGAWQIAGEPEAIDADGDDQRRGRLVGVLMKDYQLGAEFELGAKGSLRLEADGDLYLRCRNTWNELAGDRGHVTVTFQLQGQGSHLREADGRGHVGHRRLALRPPAADNRGC